MPLIVNIGLTQGPFHIFLSDLTAQKNAISQMIALCKQYAFHGLQFDFENINMNDKAAYTQFVQAAADQLHKNGCILSVAIVPRTSDLVYNDYDRWRFENWTGAYDYLALGQSTDFLSLMTYDQHTLSTTHGPIAFIDWVEKSLQFMLKVVPSNKVSLGIPSYSGYWVTAECNP